jgi:hypothetical protein
LFSLLYCLLFDQQALALILFASATPLEHDGRQSRMFACAPSQRSIAGWKKGQMIEIGACQAECALAFDQRDPGVTAKLLTTFAAGRVAGCDEYF